MRYLRMLSNALMAGLLGAAYLAVLVLQLNPQVPIASATAAHWFTTLVAFYGLYLTVAVYALIVLREILASRPLAPAWISVRLLAWLGAANASVAAWITWANLKGFRAVLTDTAAEQLRQGATATTVFAVVLGLVAVLRYSFGRRGTPATAALLFLSMALSVAVPLGLRGPGELPVPTPRGPAHAPAQVRQRSRDPSEPAPHIRIIALDGASLGLIRERVAAGQLPNFATLLERGSAIDLATLKPTQAQPVWAAAATGKYPPKNGVRSNALYRVRDEDSDPVDLMPDYCFSSALIYEEFVRADYRLTSAELRARPFWQILGDYGWPAGVLNWPLTSPARAELGYIASDLLDEGASEPLRLADAKAGWPTTAAAIARETFDAWQFRPWQDVLPQGSPEESEPDGLRYARWDHAYSEAASELQKAFSAPVTAIRYEGLNAFGRRYLDTAQPELFGQFGPPSPRSSILERYYAYIDDEVGAAVRQLDPQDLLIVISGFGMDPETLPKRLLARAIGSEQQTGSHERAPDGFLIAYGGNVAPTLSLPRGAIVDLAPTVLYYLGIPVGRDMDGFARVDLFLRSYSSEHPVTYIASHER